MDTLPSAAARTGRHRRSAGLGPRFTALWWGQAASMFGDQVAYLTIPLFVLQIADSNLDFAMTYALETIPTFLFGLGAGVLLDRVALRPLMVLADLVRAAAFFVLAWVASDPAGNELLLVFLVAFAVGSFSALFQNSLFALVPSLVASPDLARANARIAASQQATLVLGPLVAGILATASQSASPGFVINGITFLVSAVSLIWVGSVPKPPPAEEQGSYWEETVHGFRFLWGEPRLRASTVAAGVANFVVGFIEATFVVLATQVLGTTRESQIGMMLAVFGLGGLAGAAMAPRITRVLGLGRTMVVGLAAFGLALWVVVRSTYGPAVLVVLFVATFGLSLVNVPLATIRQLYAPAAMMGRVISASRTLAWSTLPLGALVGATLADAGDYIGVALVAPIIIVVTAMWLLSTPVWRDAFGPRSGKRIALDSEMAG
jgi:MFS family permease